MDNGTLIRSIALLVTWLNLLLVRYDLQPIPILSDELISIIITIAASIWAWFKNNYVTIRGKKQREVLIAHNLAKNQSKK